MEIAIRGLETVEQRLDRRAERRFARLVGSVHEHEVRIDRECALPERAEHLLLFNLIGDRETNLALGMASVGRRLVGYLSLKLGVLKDG